MGSTLSRLAAIAVLCFVTTTPFTFAADTPAPVRRAAGPPARAVAATLVVPDLRGMEYVVAEGVLEDAGFAWHVRGGNGYAANTVAAQSPAPWTRVADTGAPLVTVELSRSRTYPQRGKPVNKSPFHGTRVRPAA